MKDIYRIFEYECFVAGKKIDGYKTLPVDTFNNLREFIVENKSNNSDTDTVELMGYSVKKGIGEVITAKNYVGVLSMNDGTTIEILPKIYSDNSSTLEEQYKSSKILLLNMLKTLKDSPYKFIQKTNLSIDSINLFEVFIRMFVDETLIIAKHGLKSGYETVEGNEKFFKGKLKFTQHIKQNFAHAEQFYVEYDEFNTNRSENKLIKSTLLYLYMATKDIRNKKDIKTLLNIFENVDESNNYDVDFSKVSHGRDMRDYEYALSLCDVFLRGKSFTSFAGSKVAYALLFPMEKLFESYVADKLKRTLDISIYSMKIQDSKYCLFDRKFSLKPDIVIKNKKNNKVIILDTKWKVLSKDKTNYGISQSDMYQMYAYGHKYQTDTIYLLYPKVKGFTNGEDIKFESHDPDVNITVRPFFVDLMNVDDSLKELSTKLT